MIAFAQILLSLLAVHAVCDFPLQTDYMCRAKRPGGMAGCPWPVALSYHALIHAGGVALITGSWALGLAEFGSHWLTDFLKCRGVFGNWIDGLSHVLSKAVWAWIAVSYPPGF